MQTAVMSLRDDCDKKFVEEMNRSLGSTVRKCVELAGSMDEEEVNVPMIELYTAVTPQKNQGGEYHIGYVYIHMCMHVYLTICLHAGNTPGWFMGSVAKAAAVIKKRVSLGSPGGDFEGTAQFEEADGNGKGESEMNKRATIVDDALHVLDDHQDELKKQIALEAEIELEKKKAEEERLRLMMNVEGKMEKKSHNVWQKRYFILSTRYDNGNAFIYTYRSPKHSLITYLLCMHVYLENNPVYNLVWYKKKGDSAANSIACSTILTMTLRESSRPVSFLTDKGTLLLSHEIDEDCDDDYVEVRPSKNNKGMYVCVFICIHPNGTNTHYWMNYTITYVYKHLYIYTYLYKS